MRDGRIQLHAMFPSRSIEELKSTLLAAPHSHLFDATTCLLSSEPPPVSIPLPTYRFRLFGPKLLLPPPVATPSLPMLTPNDLFRSSQYLASLQIYLQSFSATIPTSVIRSIIADGGSFETMRKTTIDWSRTQNKISQWFRGMFIGSSSTVLDLDSLHPELKSEIWEHDQLDRRVREERLNEIFAREINLQEAEQEGQTISCGCCFGDVTFEDLTFCASGDHAFCISCVTRQVDELVHGGAPLRILIPEGGSGVGEGTGVRCLSVEDCLSPFSHSELERVLPPILFASLSQRLGEAALDSLLLNTWQRKGRKERVIRCPFCHYSELADDDVFTKAFPILHSRELTPLGVVQAGIQSFWALLLLGSLYLLLLPLGFSAPSLLVTSLPPSPLSSSSSSANLNENTLFPLLEPDRVIPLIHSYLTSCGRSLRSKRDGGGAVFRCRNGVGGIPLPFFGSHAASAQTISQLINLVWPSSSSSSVKGNLNFCGKSSCLDCGRGYVEGLHNCLVDEKESLRLRIETAMSDAVKRTCPNCGISFLKSEGCNKVRLPSLPSPSIPTSSFPQNFERMEGCEGLRDRELVQ